MPIPASWSLIRPNRSTGAQCLSAAARVGIGLDRVVVHLPILELGHDRLAGMIAPRMFDIAPVVDVAHQWAPVPTDLACDCGSASHCFCTYRFSLVGMMP